MAPASSIASVNLTTTMRYLILAYMVASVAAIAPLHKADPKSRIPGSYIVVLKPGANIASTKSNLNSAHARELKNLNMITVRMAAPAIEKARAFKDVLYIEEDGIVELDSHVAWGLDRVDQRSPIRDQEYSPKGNGSGVNVYVIDSGINVNHVDFNGRAQSVYDATGGNGVDCNGHGSHCAGIIGGTTWGIAKESNIFSVRVSGCYGGPSWSGVLAAMDYCRSSEIPSSLRPQVVSLSFGGNKGTTSAIEDAVENLYNAGIVVSVSAGNTYEDACNRTPAGAPQAITVGAIDRNDQLAWFTNTGPCVDIYAPGVDIISTWSGSSSALASRGGTSMACPHVSGAAALYLQANPQWTPAQVWDQMSSDSTQGANGIRILYVPKDD